ncbi:MAG TPA: PA2778 family cysteine peptidase, partial [Burkholderiales bacterium]|nr:PA2778 family cysteine peptidase [Burkholderiales bacterium]
SIAGGFVILTALTIASGCAALQSERLLATADAFPAPIELDDVPFFPQEEFQCGPAALATVLEWSGLPITPEQLAPQLYVPQRRGSFQLELLATARRHGRIPYVLQPQIESLAAEIASGNPVLVLQNLGLSFAPTWHYAVAVGLDLGSGEIVLRSGRERRHVTTLATFERTWRRADYWAIVIIPPEELPFTAEEIPYLQSVAAVETTGAKDVAAQAYAAALRRWPQSLSALIGLGNARYALGNLNGAEEMFRRAVKLHPSSAAAYNNLAQTLADRGLYADAETAARKALALAADGPLSAISQQTLDEILKKRAVP